MCKVLEKPTFHEDVFGCPVCGGIHEDMTFVRTYEAHERWNYTGRCYEVNGAKSSTRKGTMILARLFHDGWLETSYWVYRGPMKR